MAFAYAAGKPIAARAIALGTPDIFQNFPVMIVALAGGFTTNAIWCGILLRRNRRKASVVSAASAARPRAPFWPNLIFSALAGVTWYLQFFFYGMGTTRMGRYDFSSWTIHMAFIILFSNLWGLVLREWKGSRRRTMVIVAAGLLDPGALDRGRRGWKLPRRHGGTMRAAALTSRERLLTALDHRRPRPRPDRPGRQPDRHPQGRLREPARPAGLARGDRDHGPGPAAGPAVRGRAASGCASIPATSRPARPKASRAGSCAGERDGRTWDDFDDEFGVVWSRPDDAPNYFDISHSPLAGLSLDRDQGLSLPQGRRSQPLRRLARAGPDLAPRDALRRRQRHLRRRL